MKIHFDIDATPQELREFLGLPDVAPIQQEMLEQMRSRIMDSIAALDVQSLMKPFLPAQIQSLESWQKYLWDAMQQGASGEPREGDQE